MIELASSQIRVYSSKGNQKSFAGFFAFRMTFLAVIAFMTESPAKHPAMVVVCFRAGIDVIFGVD